MDVLYNQLDKQDQDLKNEIQRMKSNEQSDVLRRELGDAKDQLIKKDQEIARLKAKIDELQSKPGQPPVTIGGTPTKPETGETLVFKTGKSIGEGGKLALAGEPFKGLLTVRLGDVTGDNIPVEILDTNDPSKKIASQKFKRKSNFSLPFTYQGVNYVLRGSIAGVINRSLTFQIVRQGSQ